MEEVEDNGEDEAVDDRLRQEGRLRGQRQENARGKDNEENSEDEGHKKHHCSCLLLPRK